MHVAVTCGRDPSGRWAMPWQTMRSLSRFSMTSEAVRCGDGLCCDALLSRCDALLIAGEGAGDYIHTARHNDEAALFGAFLDEGIPVAGFGQGMQYINILLDGTLKRAGSAHAFGQPHRIYASENLCLPEKATVSSYHRQQVEFPGDGLLIAATDETGVPEAIMHDCSPIFAVQWQPELITCVADVWFFEYFASMCAA
ncbi:MAG: gamma-glutamyl-gamma-aminobutyrate hydrolase family protein [Christensenellales bacterium]|jgi:gamma-glutamyl-gamma-aminobutyrate hydrolase PuuD